MRFRELLKESSNGPIVVVDVQPAHSSHFNFENELASKLATTNHPVLMLVNAWDNSGTSDDTLNDIQDWWYDIFAELGLDTDVIQNWQFFDKGYGYLRSWMQYTSEEAIIKTIRLMHDEGYSDSRQLFDGDSEQLAQFLGNDWDDAMRDDSLSIGWIDVELISRFNNCYICGGAEYECLAEVLLYMDAFNIKYNIIDRFVY